MISAVTRAFFRHGNIGGAGGDDQHGSPAHQLGRRNGDDPRRFMVDRPFAHAQERSCNRGFHPRRQQRVVLPQERLRDGHHLQYRLAFAKNDFRKPLAQRAMVIERGKS
jgi:hypothetical protein